MDEIVVQLHIIDWLIILGYIGFMLFIGTFSRKAPKKIAGTLATAFGLIASVGWYIW